MSCFPCAQEHLDDLPAREAVVRTPAWRVVHAFDSALPGWLVLLPRRHVLALADLADGELTELGVLQGRLSRALRDVVGCTKTYAAVFAEQTGFEHLHVHLVPRMPDVPVDRIGPAVFAYLTDDETQWVPTDEMDRLARAVGALC